MPGGRSKYFFFNKKRRAPDKVNSAQITSAEDKKQKNIFEFFGRGKRKEPTGHELIASGEGSECKRSRKTDFPRHEAEERIGEKLDEFRARESSVDNNFSYIAQSYGVPTVSSIVTNDGTAAQMQYAESSNPTPLEKQIMELKQKYPKLLLFIECGYRYRFFGKDAEIAASVLGIMCNKDRMFLTASVPTFNGPGHYVKKLVERGHKVGIVSQTETAAEKQTSKSNSSSARTFQRALTAVYSRATMIGEDIGMGVSEVMAGDGEGNVKSMIMVVNDSGGKTSLVALQPSTGQIIHSEFVDDKEKRLLEQRLCIIEPLEIIVPKSGDADTREVVKLYKMDNADRNVTVEEADSELFTDGCRRLQSAIDHDLASRWKLVQLLPNFSDSTAGCLFVLVEYLKQFGMEAAIVASDIHSYGEETIGSDEHPPMRLPAITVRNLELFQTVTTVSGSGGKGSLFQAVNRTKTRMGMRMLRDWLSQPLTDATKIKSRQNVITYLLQPTNEMSSNFRRRAFFKSVDLEVALMAALYKKIKPVDFLRLCQTMSKMCNEAEAAMTESQDIGELPTLLGNILQEIISAFKNSEDLLMQIDDQAAKGLKWDSLFHSPVKSVQAKREEITELEAKFAMHKQEIMKLLGLFSFNYATVSGLEYLIEVKQSMARSVPKDWTKINSTKQVARFRSPFLVSNMPKLQYLRECLVAECKRAWKNFLDEFTSNLALYQKGAKSVAELDCLMSMAEVARSDGFCAPEFNSDGQVSIRQGRNLIVERSLSMHEQFVPNDVDLACSGPRALVLTGPNMGGKSCYIRQLGTIAIMAQMGCYVPAAKANLPIFDGLFVRIGARDDIWARKSTLMVELEDASLILRDASANSLVLLDELGRGTSTNDGSALARSVLEHLVEGIKCISVFVTHYKNVADMEARLTGKLVNGHMGYKAKDTEEEHEHGKDAGGKKSILFLYKLSSGQADSSFGMNVARMAGLPSPVVDLAEKVANEMKAQAESKSHY